MFRFIVLALAVVSASAAPGLVGSPVVASPALLPAASPVLAARTLGYGGLAAPLAYGGYSGLGYRSGVIGAPLASAYAAGIHAPLAAPYAAGIHAPLAAPLAAPIATSYAAGYGAYGLRAAAPLGLASPLGLGYGYGSPLLH